MAQTFAATVYSWVQETEARMLAVFKRAVELLADELRLGRQNGGKVPWDTGNMARSLVAELNAVVGMTSAGDPGAKIAMLEMGDVISLGYTAIYAMRQNFGFVGQDRLGRNYNVEGAHFVEYAASMWPVMVQLAAEELRNATLA